MPSSPSDHTASRALLAIGLGLMSAFFFTLTYVLNRASANVGGDWSWTACLRYFITIPLLLPLLPFMGGIKPVLRSIQRSPWNWIKCSGIGFVLFYTLLSFAASSGPSWLTAGSFQFTVIGGMLCAPFIYQDHRRKLSVSAILVALFILLGVLLMNMGHHHGSLTLSAWLALVAVLIAAVAYPLGNRLLLLHLEQTAEKLNATQRVFGMTLCSQPFWLLLAGYAFTKQGLPSASQVGLAAGVAMSAGVIATILFFKATEQVKYHPVALGAVEAMQSAELIFAMVLGAAFLGEAWPHGISLWGVATVLMGIGIFSFLATQKPDT